MFHFPTFPPHTLYIQVQVTRHHSCWVSPFGHPRISARLTAPRGLSQPPTSFIGSWCPGIHRVPLTTWPHKNPATPPPEGSVLRAYKNSPQTKSQKMLASTVQFSTYDQTPPTCPRQTHPNPERQPRRADGGTRSRTALTEEATPAQPGTPGNRVGPLPQDPTACLRTGSPVQAPVHARPEGRAVLGARDAGRPNWSVFHPRAPPQVRAARHG